MSVNCKIMKTLLLLLSLVLLLCSIALVFLLDSGYTPTTLLPFDLDDISLQYPVLPDSVSGYLNVGITVAIDLILVCVWVFLDNKLNPRAETSQNKFKFAMGVFIVLYGTGLVNLLTNIVKHYMGGLRPHFIEACELDDAVVQQIRATGKSWVGLEATKTICTADGKLDYRWGFPSGHTSQACYSMLLATLIVNSWEKLWSTYQFALPMKGTLQFLFFCYANLVSFSRIVDYHHHWYDVLAGAVLGCVLAVATHFWFLVPIMGQAEKQSVQENAMSLDKADSDVA